MKNRINHPTLSDSKGINIMEDILKSLEIPSKEEGYDDIIIDGDINELSFVAYYALKGKIVASASMNKSNA